MAAVEDLLSDLLAAVGLGVVDAETTTVVDLVVRAKVSPAGRGKVVAQIDPVWHAVLQLRDQGGLEP